MLGKRIFSVVWLFVVILYVESKKRTLPSYIKKCHINEDTFSRCLVENMNEMRSYLIKGIPEMRLPSVNPLIIPMVSIKIDNFVMNSTNLTIYEVANYQVKDFQIDHKEHSLKLRMYHPFLRFAANYSVDGKLLFLSLSGSGNSDVNATDVTTTLIMKGVPKKKNNLTYMDFNNNKVILEVTNASVNFDDVVQNNEQLTLVTNKIINDNIIEFLKELNPYIEETIGAYIFAYIKNVFNLFPLEDLYVY